MIPAHLLDVFTGLLCIVCLSGLCLVYVVTSPRRPIGIDLPLYVRAGPLIFGVFLMVRAGNLLTLKVDPSDCAANQAAGHANLIAMLTTIALTYAIGAFIVFTVLKARQARRLNGSS